jgi:putative Mn2+ efflux pump MntP
MAALLILSLALAMDAFAVSLARGASGPRSLGRAVELGLVFGAAQGLMPLVGWSLGRALAGPFQAFDHWIAFLLLTILGIRMLVAARGDGPAPAAASAAPPGRVLGLATAAVATSIDAAAAGLTLPLLGTAIPLACLTIGATTALLSTAGYLLGNRAALAAGKAAEAAGGVVLILLGLKILTEHLTA